MLAPWVGPLADRRSKPHVLLIGNVLKAAGAGLMFAGVEPMAAYALVGAGAAVYGPAKYGILPELVGKDRLVRANGWIEGSTIVAIVLGTVVGSRVADRSVPLALTVVMACYLASATATFGLPRLAAAQADAEAGIATFVTRMRTLFEAARGAFRDARQLVVLGVGGRAAPVARRVGARRAGDAKRERRRRPHVVSGARHRRRSVARSAAHSDRALAARASRGLRDGRLRSCCSASRANAWPARAVLVAIGVCGGMFLVPINAALQDIGHRTIGSGRAVALQSFFENSAMLTGVGHLHGVRRARRPAGRSRSSSSACSC